MANRQVCVFLTLFRALFDDLKGEFPVLTQELERDLRTLVKQVECRGVGVVLKDLPALCKHFDQCLDTGAYVPSCLPLSRGVNRTVVIPKFLRGLYLRIFDCQGQLKEDVDVSAIRAVRQVYRLVSKSKLVCPDDKVEACKASFLEVDCSLPEPSGLWQNSGLVPEDLGETLRFEDVLRKTPQGEALLKSDPSVGSRLDRVFACLATTLGRYDPLEWRHKHGPGAVSAVPLPDNQGRLCGNKYHWVSWPERLESVYPIADHGFYSYGSWAASVSSDPARMSWRPSPLMEGEEVSRLIAVPKSFDKPRLIAAEPHSHAWCQQNLLAYMLERSAATWIGSYVSFRDQGLNQELCRRGSLDGSLCTLDLSDASDRISCNLVEAAFRSNPGLLRALIACRTRFVAGVTDEKSVHGLKKFSTMGSAVTFPVESFLFLGICLAVTGWQLRDPKSLQGALAVFGDDIVAPTQYRDSLVRLLEALSLKVNPHKTFSGSNFRESCGCDAFRGVSVTPCHVRVVTPSCVDDLVGMVETTNHFYQRWQLNVSDVLRRTVREYINFPDIHPSSTVIGFKSFVAPPTVPQFRWNRDLQRLELKVWGIRARRRISRPNDDSGLFQFFTELPSPHDKWEAGQSLRTRLKPRASWVPAYDLYRSWLDKGE